MEPPERLRRELAAARGLGFAFADCWPGAVILASRSSSQPGEWLVILGNQRDVWERMFARMPSTAPEQALSSLGRGRPPDRDYELEGRQCQHCGRLLPVDLDPRARFCEDRPCKRQFNYQLERRRAQGLPDVVAVEHLPAGEKYPPPAFERG